MYFLKATALIFVLGTTYFVSVNSDNESDTWNDTKSILRRAFLS